jgi:K+-transporting ATPase ATPase C chain
MNMRAQFRPALVALLVFALLTGILYPLLITGIAQLLFAHQANGSLIMYEDQAVGSELIGQSFASPQYFWGRPSSTAGQPYNALDQDAVTGSRLNLGPSQTLVDAVRERGDPVPRPREYSDPCRPVTASASV